MIALEGRGLRSTFGSCGVGRREPGASLPTEAPECPNTSPKYLLQLFPTFSGPLSPAYFLRPTIAAFPTSPYPPLLYPTSSYLLQSSFSTFCASSTSLLLSHRFLFFATFRHFSPRFTRAFSKLLEPSPTFSDK